MKGWRYELVELGKALGIGDHKYLSFYYYDDQHFSYGYARPVLKFEVHGANSSRNSCEIIRMKRALNNHFIKKTIKSECIEDLLSKSVEFIISDGYEVDEDKVPNAETIKKIITNELK